MRIHNLATTKRTRRRLESANRSPSFESVQATVRSLWDVVEAADDSAQGKIKREISDTINRLKSRVEISLVIVQFPCAMNHPCSSKQLANLREAGTLRRIKRFANALMDGVPCGIRIGLAAMWTFWIGSVNVAEPACTIKARQFTRRAT